MKKMLFTGLISVLLLSCGENKYIVNSPDGTLSVTIIREKDGTKMSVRKNDSIVMTALVNGVKFEESGYDFTENLIVKKVENTSVSDEYYLPTGKKRHYAYSANQLTLSFENAEKHRMDLIVRVQDDGVAFRYTFDNSIPLRVEKENTAYYIPAHSSVWSMEYCVDSENEYLKRSAEEMNADIYHFPALVETPAHQWVLLHEADAIGKSIASNLSGNKGAGRLDIAWNYPPLQREPWMGKWADIIDADVYDINASENFITPWRMMIIGDKLGTIVESTLTEDLNPLPEIGDMDWISPGVAVFPWWGDHNANQDITVLKKYVDCAQEMNWKVIEFDVSLIGSPDFAIDQWLSTPWIKDLTDYAHARGIQVYGWDERRNLDTPEKRAFIYSKYNELGIDGIKIDFVNSHAQLANEFREACLKDAAHHKLLVSFHGDYTPRGERKRFPNLMTQEGVRGSEYYGGKTPPNPVHNATLPFTRNVIGPMDYTPTAYSEKTRITSYAHETALAFLYESGWVAMCDKPEMYLNSPAKDILKTIEASWDEIRFIDGYPGKFAVLARRKGDKWVVAGINAGKERDVTFSLDMLDDKTYRAAICKDALTDSRNQVLIEEKTVVKDDAVSMKMAENGGFVLVAVKQNN